MEQTGVEPVSENLSTELSTIIAYLFLFPQNLPVSRQARFGSFINLSHRQSLLCEVPRIVEASGPTYGSMGGDPPPKLGSVC